VRRKEKTNLKTDVIIESRYGICSDLSCSLPITLSKKNNDELIYFDSFNTVPEEFVFETLSLPAKSTRCNLDLRTLSLPTTFVSNAIEKIQCDREEAYQEKKETIRH
jgi:hypothetical protein